MSLTRQMERPRNGQIIVVFALALTAIVLLVGLVIDGGNALAQRRASQNASDFAALAGARIIAESISGDTTNGTDANVQGSMAAAVVINGGTPLTFGAPDGPRYVDEAGGLMGYVGAGSIPVGAVGVSVTTTRSWTPYFLGIAGFNNWSASAPAVAKGGWAAGGPSGDVFPVGVAEAFFDTYGLCSGPISADPSDPCYPKHLTPGNLNVPGGFGWLKFGAADKCTGFGLGMDPNSGCDSSKPFLQSEIGPPPNSHGCCSAVNGGPYSDANPNDMIGSLTGNKVSADCDYYIDNEIVVTVPVWDDAGGTGANGWYHIIGFAGFQLTDCNGGKDIEGIWRRAIFQGPTTATKGFEGAALAVQLVR